MIHKKSRGTYRITFKDDTQYIFGNNYKAWWEQAREHIFRYHGNREHGWRYDDIVGVVIKVEFSNQQFYDDGGLKWVSWKGYQEVIDDVVKQQKLAPVKAEDIIFAEDADEMALLIKKLKEY